MITKTVSLLFAMICLLGLFSPAQGDPPAASIPSSASIADGTYTLQPELAPGERLDVDKGRSDNGTVVHLWSESHLKQQNWTFAKIREGVYYIRPAYAPNMALDVAGAGTASGSKIDIYSDQGATNQEWIALAQKGGVAFAPVNAPALRLTATGNGDGDGVDVETQKSAPDPSQTWVLTKFEIPSTPRVYADSDNSVVVVHWNPIHGANTYNIYRGTTPGSETGQPWATVTRPVYADFSVKDGQPYCYRVAAVNPAGASAESEEVVCTPEPGPKLRLAHGTPGGSPGPSLITDGSFESWDPTPFGIDDPFLLVKDSDAHSGIVDVKASLSRSGKTIAQQISVWKDTDYVSSVWVKGGGSGTFFVASDDSSHQLASVAVTAPAHQSGAAISQWRKVSLSWNSGSSTGVLVGFRDDVSRSGTLTLDDFYTGLRDAKTLAFTAPAAGDPKPHAPPGFHLIFDDEFDNANENEIDTQNTHNDGYKWYGHTWNGDTPASFYSVLPSYEGANGVLCIKDALTNNSEGIETTFPDSSVPQGWRGIAFGGGRGLYWEARMAMANYQVYGAANPVEPTGAEDPAFWAIGAGGDGGPPGVAPPGQPKHSEGIEDDIIEFNPDASDWPAGYSSGMINWNDAGHFGGDGMYVYQPADTDNKEWHTYGELWVPGSAENGWYGYRQAYLDGRPQQALCWRGNQPASSWPPSGSDAFSYRDLQWFNLMLGAARGGTPTMYVDYVRVYAVDPKSSLRVSTRSGLASGPTPSKVTRGR